VLSDPRATSAFEPAAELPEGVVSVNGATESLLLEALGGVPPDGVREMLGNLDQRLETTTALAEEQRTLTLTEGYVLSRIDGQCSARQVLQLVPMDRDDAERTLAGLVLTGRVARLPGPASRARTARSRAANPNVAAADSPAGPTPQGVSAPDSAAAEGATAAESEEPLRLEIPFGEPEPPELSEEQQAERKEIVDFFQSLPRRNHFEVLGLRQGCAAADLKLAHVALIKRYHPDMRRDEHLADLHDILEAIFIRVGEAWETLGDEKKRAAYEARLPPARPPDAPGKAPEPLPDADEEAPAIDPESTLGRARQLLGRARYWDAIQMLESAVPRFDGRRHQHLGRILLARAYSQNPKWVHRAVETLKVVVSEDPDNAEAHYELGCLYKAGGLTARSQATFRRVLELRPDHKKAAAQLQPAEPAPAGGLMRRLFGGKGKSA
jgi:tetratricopeptide (TPR) repeat protein